MDSFLLNLLVALICNEFIHNCFEIWGMRQKVTWLHARMDKRPHGKWPININTAAKAYGLHAGMYVFITSLIFLPLLWLDLQTSTLLKLGVVVLTVSYALTTLTVHEFHTEIGRLLRRFKQ